MSHHGERGHSGSGESRLWQPSHRDGRDRRLAEAVHVERDDAGLLGEPARGQVRNVYALVRVADEVVDNPDPAIGTESRDRMLTWLEDDVRHALAVGYSANPVVHAFARTAGEVGITMDVVEPFFDSMRADLTERRHTQESFERYVYGSAEVVGLLTPQANTTAEIEFNALMPLGVSSLVARMTSRCSTLEARLLEYFDQLDLTLEDRKSTRLNSSHSQQSRMPSSA